MSESRIASPSRSSTDAVLDNTKGQHTHRNIDIMDLVSKQNYLEGEEIVEIKPSHHESESESESENERETSHKRDVKTTRSGKLQQTGALFLGYSVISFMLCVVGPSLLDLQITANTDTKSMPMIFVGRAIGGVMGSLVFALVLTRWNRWRVAAGAYFVMATTLAAVPWLGNITAVTVIYGIGAIAYNIADTGINVSVLHIWREKNGPWIQALHACYFIGCTLSPILVKPFLVMEATDSRNECSGVTFRNESIFLYRLNDNISSVTVSKTATTLASLSVNENVDVVIEIWKPYLIAAVILTIPCMLFTTVSCIFTNIIDSNHLRDTFPRNTTNQGRQGKLYFVLISLMALNVFADNSMERMFGNYLLAYVTSCLGWYKDEAALLKTAYQASGFAGRVICMVVVRFLPASTLFAASCLVCLVSVVTMITWGDQEAVTWTVSVLISLFSSPMYGLCLSWCSQYIVISGKVGAVLTTTGPLADIVAASVINGLYDRYGLATFPYYCLALSIIMAVTFCLISIDLKFMPQMDQNVRVQDIFLEENFMKSQNEKPDGK